MALAVPYTKVTVVFSGAQTAGELVAAVTDKRIRVRKVRWSKDTAGRLALFHEVDASGTLFLDIEVDAIDQGYLDFPADMLEAGAAGDSIEVTTTGTGDTRITIWYSVID